MHVVKQLVSSNNVQYKTHNELPIWTSIRAEFLFHQDQIFINLTFISVQILEINTLAKLSIKYANLIDD